MSVGGEIKKLKEYLRDGRRSIVARGGDISTIAGLRDFPTAIYNIPADNAISTITQNQVARFVPVPENSTKYGYLAEFGGMTYKCKQLIPYPYFNSDKTIDGVTYTVGKDGGISVSGVAGEFAQFVLAESVTVYPTTYTMRMYGKFSNIQGTVTVYDESGVKLIDYQIKSSAVTINLTSYPAAKSARIYLKRTTSGVEATGTIYPMFNLGNTEAPYELYYEGLRDTKPTEIVSEGANIIPYPFDFTSYTQNGITFTANEDQTISISGTATNNASVGVLVVNHSAIKAKAGEIYTLSTSGIWTGKNGYVVAYQRVNGVAKTYVSAHTTPKTFTVEQDCDLTITVVVISGETYDGSITIMLNRGTEAAPYKPYIGAITIRAIPEAIQALDGYGKGISLDYYNKVDLVNKKYINRVRTVVFDGTENVQRIDYTTSSFYYVTNNSYGAMDSTYGICSHFDRAFASRNVIRFYVTEQFSTTDDLKAYLAEQYANGNPVTVTYALAEPIESDLPASIAPLIEVEGGGSLEFANEYDYGVPSKSVYQVKAE